jgi:hypothetical protein
MAVLQNRKIIETIPTTEKKVFFIGEYSFVTVKRNVGKLKG